MMSEDLKVHTVQGIDIFYDAKKNQFYADIGGGRQASEIKKLQQELKDKETEIERLRKRIKKQSDYSIALQRLIEHHCNNQGISNELKLESPYLAGKLLTKQKDFKKLQRENEELKEKLEEVR